MQVLGPLVGDVFVCGVPSLGDVPLPTVQSPSEPGEVQWHEWNT